MSKPYDPVIALIICAINEYFQSSARLYWQYALLDLACNNIKFLKAARELLFNRKTRRKADPASNAGFWYENLPFFKPIVNQISTLQLSETT